MTRDGKPLAGALERTSHLGIAAHPDDLEIMTWHGIGSCIDRDDRWFSGVVVTDGAGSSRSGRFASLSDDEMRQVRFEEQVRAARDGQYSALVHLAAASGDIVGRSHRGVIDDLAAIIATARPEYVYTHSPLDGHRTHLAVVGHLIAALRIVPPDQRPRALYGCEVWGSLDWLPASRRVAFDVSGRAERCTGLIAVHESQIAGGKRYDLATLGRKRANATYHDSHQIDSATALEYAIDLSELLDDSAPALAALVDRILDEACQAMRSRLASSAPSTAEDPS